MKVWTLDNEQIDWTPKGDSPVYDLKARSSLHSSAKKILHEKYPTVSILQEVSIPVRRNQKLALDLYIPLFRLAVEVQGQQHFKYVPHFHGTIEGFVKSRRRDQQKADWCDLNGITLVFFNYNEELDEWRSKL